LVSWFFRVFPVVFYRLKLMAGGPEGLKIRADGGFSTAGARELRLKARAPAALFAF
jgi:hypothetical protein